ncbi:hypothetical protein Taro_054685 [Colocasia esculenta]|uniref:Uncharacterized protein n=1 Tax=Colocasia esculenta TaxID=4460 RepID=A0A843XRZ0_COLES|nr:hypothetical protein [Colocasia esculenta]
MQYFVWSTLGFNGLSGGSLMASVEIKAKKLSESVSGSGGGCIGNDDLDLLSLRKGQTFSCKGSVDTTINGVDTMAQSKGRNVKKRSTSVDTSPGSTLETSPKELICQSGIVCRHTSWAGRHTLESL